ncbi:MAG TPA: hypothetical protein EYQ71_09340 [Candidatus Thioglobus sp.]|jgi:hypothetical protein|nr:hypothetical protein [Candidatus Thioglobus sp.]
MFGLFDKSKIKRIVPAACIFINANISRTEFDKDSLPKFLEYDPYLFGYFRGIFGMVYLQAYEKQGSDKLMYTGAIELLKMYFPDANKEGVDNLFNDNSTVEVISNGLKNAVTDYTRGHIGEVRTSLADYLLNDKSVKRKVNLFKRQKK